MQKKIDLKNGSIKQLFTYYLFSSVLGMVIQSIHIMLDGIFVSNGVCPEALAAINIFMPIVTAAIAFTLAISVGGSTLASIYFGKGNEKNAQNIFIVSSVLILLTGIIFSSIFLLSPKKICTVLGANNQTISYAIEYGKYICYFLPFYTLAIGISVFVRNDRNPKLSMISMAVSAVINATLNYILIFKLKMGLKGAAIATGVSQIIACIILLLHFKQNVGIFRLDFKNFSFKNGEIFSCFKIGFPNFLANMSYAIVSIVFNKTLIRLGGANAVWAFTTMIYITTFLYNIYYGMGQGIQPIISYNYGAKNYDRVYESYHLATKYGLISAFCIGALCIIFVKQIVMLFTSTDSTLIEMGVQANIYIFYFIPIIAYNIMVSTFFQSIGKSLVASVLSFLRGIVFIICLIFILSKLLGLLGIWLVYPLTEVLSMILCIIFMRKQDIIKKII